MTNSTQQERTVDELSTGLVAAGFAPFVGTRCAALTPLRDALARDVGVLDVPRNDNAIGIAAGMSLAGGHPAVLLRDSGPGGSAEVIASVVAAHEVPMLLIVALDDGPAEPVVGHAALVRLSEQVLDEFGIQSVALDPTMPAAGPIDVVRGIVRDQRRPAALLVPCQAIGRRP